MKIIFVLFLLIFSSCADEAKKEKKEPIQAQSIDTVLKNIDTFKLTHTPAPIVEEPNQLSNDRFRNVVVIKKGDNEFLVVGKARVFEASFNWVIEDGHQEIDSGYSTTDAGAPEWGNFRFTLKPKKNEPNTVRHLILYEASAKDGSRQSELPILLK